MQHIVIKLRANVVADARSRAAAAGVPVDRWCAQVVESFVAGERCAHHPPPAPSPPDVDAEASDD